ncbi:MAG: Ig-like domain-containing protein [Bacteroidota bacterium]
MTSIFVKKLIQRFARCISLPIMAGLMAAFIIPAVAYSQSPAPLDLGCTETFAVLAGSTVTSTGATIIDGNVGLSPGSGIVGFPPATVVNGAIHVNDALANNGKGCLTIAYNDAAGRTPVPTGTFLNPGSGNIGGLTLVAGLYKFTSAASITGSDVTLTGSATDVWIFQIASDLNVGNGVHVVLGGAAQAKNIFWQVGTSATIGTTVIMKGTILADQSISLNTGAVLDGRAMARIGAVTLAGNVVTKPPLDITPPTVVSTVPADTATLVFVNQTLTATFSELMDQATITSLTFTLKQGLNPVPGVVSYAGLIATLNPTSNLLYNTIYTATITTGAKDLGGNGLASNYVWTFTTGAAPDTIPPTVISTIPVNLAIAVAKDQNITATFSELMDQATISGTTFTLMQGVNPVPGVVSYAGLIATLNPTSYLLYNTIYTATITTGAKDLGGNGLASNYVWTFTTGAAPDTIPPMVSSTDPENNDTAIFVNQSVAATFTEIMDAATITTSSFTLKQGATVVPGSVSVVGVTAIYNPTSFLVYSTLYTATITTAVKDLAGNAMVSDYTWTFTTGAAPDTIGPIVRYTIPAYNAVNIPVNQQISVAFSEAMDPQTITSASVIIDSGSVPIAGTVTYVGVIALFSPTSFLAYNTQYTGTITTAVTDLAGNPMARSYTWHFRTGAAPDTIPPVVSYTIPVNGETQVHINQRMAATFSEAMDPATITTASFLVKAGAIPVLGNVTYVGVTATFNPIGYLAYHTEYTATITTGATDLAGNPLAADYIWVFKTGAAPDTIPPTVTSTVPLHSAAATVPINQILSATFSEAMNPLTISTTTFLLSEGGNPVMGTVTYAGFTAKFNPLLPLLNLTTYTATITSSVKDLAGNKMVTNYVWNFTTSVVKDTTAPTVSSTDPVNAAKGVHPNHRVIATFSEAMDPLTINARTFTLNFGLIPIPGVVTYVGITATFTPLTNLANNTRYTGTITTAATDLAGNPMANDYSWSFTTGTFPDTIAPTVISTIPVNAATNVPNNQKIAAIFSEIMDPLTITTASFTLMEGLTPVAGTVSYVGVTATFTPTNALVHSTIYTARITNAVQDVAGLHMASDYIWYFISGPVPDTTAPYVRFTIPHNNDTDVPVNQKLAATFSEAMDPLTITNMTFTLSEGLMNVPGSVVYRGLTATFTPNTGLTYNTTYTATITTSAMDLAGNPLAADYVWTFDTYVASDLTAPTVVSTDPANFESGVAVNKTLSVKFSEDMDPLTITSTSFTLWNGTLPVIGMITSVGTDAFFNPSMHLAPNTTYNATITTGVTDLAGNPLAMNYNWSFTTGARLPDPLTIDLDCANTFTILAGSTVTSTGNTIVHGDLGLSPGTAVVGFPPGQVLNGSIHINDALANNAKLCLTVAYNDAAGRTLNAIIVSDGELGGKTLAPGLYRSAPGSFGITNSDLTLDAQGNVNAVWIFQMPSSTLTVGNGRQVILAGGANSKNIFWQIGSSATIGTTADMKGTMMADQSITLKNGAVLNGRALARIGAVTMDNNTAIRPDIILAIRDDLVPADYTLSQNYPNPFNPVTQIEYGIAKPGMVTLRIYNTFGVEVATLVNSYQEAGNYTVSFNSNEATPQLTSGMYFYRLEAGTSISMSRKFILLK